MAENAEPDTPNGETGPERASGVDPRLLEILICPVTRTPLTYDREAGELVSKKAGLAYPIRDGLPILLEEEARELSAPGDGPAAP